MDTQIPMIRGAVEAEVDSERDGGPCRILLAAIKAYLANTVSDEKSWLGRGGIIVGDRGKGEDTLLAGFDFSFSKIFCDWAFVAVIVSGKQMRIGRRRTNSGKMEDINEHAPKGSVRVSARVSCSRASRI